MNDQSPTLASQATAELPKLPEPKQHAPIYPDESREDQYAAARYVTGWNDCHAAFTRYLAGYEAGRASQSEWISEVTEKAQALVNFLDTAFSLVSLGKGEAMLNDLRDVLGAGATTGETK